MTPLYLICIFVVSCCCSLGLVGPTAALNFLIQVALVGRGVGRFSVMGTLSSQVARYFLQNLLMYVWKAILM
jgi:hypothetical protein